MIPSTFRMLRPDHSGRSHGCGRGRGMCGGGSCGRVAAAAAYVVRTASSGSLLEIAVLRKAVKVNTIMKANIDAQDCALNSSLP